MNGLMRPAAAYSKLLIHRLSIDSWLNDVIGAGADTSSAGIMPFLPMKGTVHERGPPAAMLVHSDAVGKRDDMIDAMIVDDSRSARARIGALITSIGDMHHEGFERAEDALAVAGQRHFDLVIVDHFMPKMNGIDLIAHLRAKPHYAQVPIVMLTAAEDRTIRIQALEAGATDFLSKAADIVELRAKMRNFLILADAVRRRDDQATWLAREVEQATEALRVSNEEMVFRLALAVEYRDSDTGEHTLRVALYSRLIAEELGLAPDLCREIYLAAPLHDIGKVAIPDHILLKPGRLDRDEILVMQTHASVGERILSNGSCTLMRLSAEIAGHHHERWDGGGYPRGLAGEAIPLSARIVAVADVFDALTTQRPYKAAMGKEAALAWMRQERGRHFDPRCVDAFVTAYARLSADTGARSLGRATVQPERQRAAAP